MKTGGILTSKKVSTTILSQKIKRRCVFRPKATNSTRQRVLSVQGPKGTQTPSSPKLQLVNHSSITIKFCTLRKILLYSTKRFFSFFVVGVGLIKLNDWIRYVGIVVLLLICHR